MALEAVVFQQDHIFGYNAKDLSNAFVEEEPRFYDLHGSLNFLGNQTENFDCTFPQDDYCWSVPQDSTGLLVTDFKIPNSYSSNSSDYPNCYNSSCNEQQQPQQQQQGDNANSSGLNRAKRRRSKTRKNKEEIENQRMTHIAVERNRRKQMNEYLSVLRSLMPESYVQRGDQASIVGGAINFVRELEHRLHRLSVHGDSREKPISGGGSSSSSSADPFSDFFKFPQFSTGSCSGETGENNAVLEANALADIEVSLIESHASLKIRTKRRPKLLLNVVSGLQSLGFIILHLNVSTADDFVLYCFSTKVEDDCKLTSVADIATAVYQMLCLIHQHEVVVK